MTNPPPKEILFSYKLYNCEYCSFHTNNKKDYDKHLLTNKLATIRTLENQRVEILGIIN